MHEMLHYFRNYTASHKLVLAFPDFHALSIKNDLKRMLFVTIASLFVSFKQCSFLKTRFPNPQRLTLPWPLSLLVHIYSSSFAKQSELKQSSFVKFMLHSFNEGHRLDFQVASRDTTWCLSLWHTLCSSEHVFGGMQHILEALRCCTLLRELVEPTLCPHLCSSCGVDFSTIQLLTEKFMQSLFF